MSAKTNTVPYREPFIMLPKIAIAPLTASELKVLCAIMKYNPAYPSLNRLVKDTNLSIATVCKAKNKLVEYRIIQVKKGKARKKANEYTVTEPSTWQLAETINTSEVKDEKILKATTKQDEVVTTSESTTEVLQKLKPKENNPIQTNVKEIHQQQSAVVKNSNSWLTAVLRQTNPKQLLINTLVARWWESGKHESELTDVVATIEEHFSKITSVKGNTYKDVLIATATNIHLMFQGLYEIDTGLRLMIKKEFLLSIYDEIILDFKENKKLLKHCEDYRSKCNLTAEKIAYVRIIANVHHLPNKFQWAFEAQKRLLAYFKTQKSQSRHLNRRPTHLN